MFISFKVNDMESLKLIFNLIINRNYYMGLMKNRYL